MFLSNFFARGGGGGGGVGGGGGGVWNVLAHVGGECINDIAVVTDDMEGG